MDLKLHFSLPWFFAACLVTSSLHCNSASAQVTSDGTTGTIVDANGNSFEINAGTRSGDNLFHSFGEFSVPNGGEAVFNNATDVSNILSRVTGGNISSINGLIQAQGGANLFLINPAGIIFGQGASLNIGGSFYGSTADSIVFEDGEFSAVDNLNQPILTINAPIGLNLRNNPADITINGTANATDLADFSLLSVLEDESLNIVGGNLDINNAILFAPGGIVSLGGLQGSGTVNINENGNISFPENIARGNISLDNSNVLVNFASNGEGGTINFNGNNIELLDGSALLSGIDADSGFAEAQAGNINLNATGAINITEASSISNIVDIGGTGNAGDINITAGSLAIADADSLISTSTFGQGDAGNIIINTSGNTDLNESKIFSQVGETGVGTGGNITVKTTDLSLTNGSQITAGVFGQGNAGKVTINALGTTTFQGIGSNDLPSGILNNIAPGGKGDAGDIEISSANLKIIDGAAITSNAEGQGNAGNINIRANSFSLSNQARLNSSTFGQGNTGNITIDVDGTVNLTNDANIFSNVRSGAKGNGGLITINAGSLAQTNGSQIQNSVLGANEELDAGKGNAGSVIINVTDNVEISGSGQDGNPSAIFSDVDLGGEGNAGNIEINAASLTLSDGSFLQSSTDGQGNAGNITIDVDGAVNLTNNADIFSNIEFNAVVKEGARSTITIDAGSLSIADAESSISTSTLGQGDAGNIVITTTKLNLTNGAAINASTYGEGDAGNVFVNASDSITLDSTTPNGQFGSGIFNTVNQGAKGNGGSVEITTSDLSISNGAAINAGTYGEGNAGNVFVNASDSITLDGTTPNGQFVSGIFNTVNEEAKGNGNSIEITTSNLSITNGAAINAGTYGEGDGGNIFVNAEDSITLDGTTPDGEFSSAIASQVYLGARGNGGSIEVTTPNLEITNGAGIFASTEGEGDGGDLTFNIGNTLTLDENSTITAQVFKPSNANGGDITINAQDGFVVASPNQNEGNGNDIVAKSPTGKGGNIIINAEGVLGLEEGVSIDGNGTNDIDASGDVDGVVEINTPNSDAIGGATKLPNNPVEPGKTVNQACVSARGTGGNNLVVTGKGGIPNDPTAPLVSELININGDLTQAASPQSTGIQPIVTGQGVIIPAQGVEVKENGDVILTAYPTNNNSRIPQRATSCGKSWPNI
jgi:filamentous hemagglutinin family protein